MPIASGETPQEHRAQQRDQDQRDQHLLAVQRRRAGTGSPGCARVASAADRVIVMMKSVAAKPSSTSTKSLPAHLGRTRSSIAIEPWPCGLSRATRR